MPRPVYIILSSSGVEDSQTRLVSLFNVLERIEVAEHLRPTSDGKQSMHVQLLEFRVSAVWMKLPEDNPEQEYQHQIVLCLPDGTEHVLCDDTRAFFASDDRPLMRFLLDVKAAPFAQSGIVRVESRLRKVKEESWARQDYPLAVVHTYPDSAEAQRAAEKSATGESGRTT